MDNIIVLATSNKNKLKEIQEILKDFPVAIKSLSDFGPMPEAVEDGETFDDNAYKKALHYAKVLGVPCLADDSGLVVDALDGRPGVYSARYSAHFVCVLSLATPAGPALTWEGRCDGELIAERRGEAGFGYDPIFFSPDLGKTFAEASMAEKSAISHRGRALADFAAEFSKVQVWLRQRMAEIKPPKPDHSEFEHNDWSKDRM